MSDNYTFYTLNRINCPVFENIIQYWGIKNILQKRRLPRPVKLQIVSETSFLVRKFMNKIWSDVLKIILVISCKLPWYIFDLSSNLSNQINYTNVWNELKRYLFCVFPCWRINQAGIWNEMEYNLQYVTHTQLHNL